MGGGGESEHVVCAGLNAIGPRILGIEAAMHLPVVGALVFGREVFALPLTRAQEVIDPITARRLG
jgi:hypothetical protein